MVNYCQSMVFACPYLLCNDHSDQWVFQEIFFIIILYREIILNNLELVILQSKHF